MRQSYELMMADRYLRGFFASEYAEYSRLGFPRRAAFAVDIARGSVSMPPPTQDDPVHDAIGCFVQSRRAEERQILTNKYLPSAAPKELARRLGRSVRSWYRALRRLLDECVGWLQGRGYL